MDFVLPPLLWLGVGKRSLPWRILNWAIVVGYSGIAIAGAFTSQRYLVWFCVLSSHALKSCLCVVADTVPVECTMLVLICAVVPGQGG